MTTYRVTIEETRLYRTIYEVEACDDMHAQDKALLGIELHGPVSEEYWDMLGVNPDNIDVKVVES